MRVWVLGVQAVRIQNTLSHTYTQRYYDLYCVKVFLSLARIFGSQTIKQIA